MPKKKTFKNKKTLKGTGKINYKKKSTRKSKRKNKVKKSRKNNKKHLGGFAAAKAKAAEIAEKKKKELAAKAAELKEKADKSGLADKLKDAKNMAADKAAELKEKAEKSGLADKLKDAKNMAANKAGELATTATNKASELTEKSEKSGLADKLKDAKNMAAATTSALSVKKFGVDPKKMLQNVTENANTLVTSVKEKANNIKDNMLQTQSPENLPEGWTKKIVQSGEYKDKAFYYEHEDGRSQWEKP